MTPRTPAGGVPRTPAGGVTGPVPAAGETDTVPVRRRPTPRDVGLRLRRQAPLLVVLAVVAVGFWRVGLQHWRQGTALFGLALLLGAGLRAFLDDAAAGLLAVRTRRTDYVLYGGLGVVVLFVALTITGGPLAGS